MEVFPGIPAPCCWTTLFVDALGHFHFAVMMMRAQIASSTCKQMDIEEQKKYQSGLHCKMEQTLHDQPHIKKTIP